MMSFKEQLEKFKQEHGGHGSCDSKIDYFRKNYDSMMEVVVMLRNPKIRKQVGQSAYKRISAMCEKDGHEVSESMIGLYLNLVREERGVSRSKGTRKASSRAYAVLGADRAGAVSSPSLVASAHAAEPSRAVLPGALVQRSLEELKALGWNNKKVEAAFEEAYDRYRFGKKVQPWTQDLEDATCFLKAAYLEGNLHNLYEAAHYPFGEKIKYGDLYEFLKTHKKT
ncbi:MAG: hypothetical protein ACXV2C_01055 [Candidatus Bathyarchaeia archaeon]